MSDTTEIKRLVENFREQIESYKKGKYNETQLRREYLDPFFAALGWDIENKDGYAEAYKDVVHEDAIKVGGATKAPDYSFRVGGVRKFFVEAKKPSVNIKEDTSPAYQLRRYAWSAKLPISILTDFEEFAVYDCRKTPKPNDKASTGRIFYTTFDKFLEQWDEIAGIFSREAILKGAFDKYADSKKTRGTAEVDDEFLKEMESWREALAKNIAFKNKGLSIRELNHAVQLTIDRIVFLRICEDRGIEPYGKLQALLNGKNVYERLTQLFMQADDKYNSGLFHFTKEKDRPGEPDSLTPSLDITDAKLKDIIKRLYYPESPYEFSVISGDILGQVYERFLGKVIVPKGRGVDIEEKPEVRKAGGVYYTPTYIVDYIVKNTVGKLVEGKTPKKVEKLRVLDPACGSGSFLLGAYQYLLDWHRDWYASNEPKKHAKGKQPKVFLFRENDWRLTTSEKKRILLNNIYGVDIDTQAVEVTKLSLLLKVLEGESEETLLKQFQLFKERALPDLRANIKCGNSLIGPDFYEGKDLSLFGEDEQYRINVFDWESEFAPIMKAGGFDAVIGNPPYGFHLIHSDHFKVYFQAKYQTVSGSFEHYFLFYERTLGLVKKNGYHGYIVPVTWLTIPSAKLLRKHILESYNIAEICWLPSLVFKNAQVNTLTSIIKNGVTKFVTANIYNNLGFLTPPAFSRKYKQKEFLNNDSYAINIFVTEDESILLRKLFQSNIELETIAHPCSGYNPYEVGKGEKPEGGAQTIETVREKPYHSNKQLNNKWKPEIIGRNLKRYSINTDNNRWIKYGSWLAAPRDPNNYLGKRILVQEITGGAKRRIVAAYCDKELYYSRDVIPIKVNSDTPHAFYLLGIINSWLITWMHQKRNPKSQKNLFPKVLVSDLKKLPIRTIDFDDAEDVAKHDRMVELVETMLELNKKLPEANTDHNKNLIQRQIDYTDNQIDKLVYELYDLTEDEIKIVEGE